MNTHPFVIIGAVLVLVAFVIWACLRKESKQFDERQLLKRANAFRFGFFCMLGGNAVLMILLTWRQWTDRVETLFTLIAVFMTAFLVFAVYCILNDAFFGNKENPKGYIGICFAVIFLQVMTVVSFWGKHKTLLDNGKVTMTPCGNALIGVTFLIIAITIIVKLAINRKERDDEES